MNNQPHFLRGFLSALAVVLLWGVQPFFMRVSLQQFDAYTISWARFFLSTLFFAIYLSIRDGNTWIVKIKEYLFPLFVAGGFLVVNYCTFLTGIKLGGALTATILIQIGPLLLALVGVIVYKERFSKFQILAIVIALSGFGLFYSDRVQHSAQGALQQEAALYVLVAAITWVAFCLFQKKYTPHIGVFTFNLGIFIFCTILLLPFLSVKDITDLNKLFSYHFLAVAYLGLSTALAYTALGEALRLLPASYVSLIIVTNPFVTILGVEILSMLSVSWIEVTPLSAIGYLGTLLALVGVGSATAFKKSA